MKTLFRSLFLFYIFIANVVGFNTIQMLPKLKNQNINTNICMGLQRREFVFKPFDILKLIALTPFVMPLINPKQIKAYDEDRPNASESDDYWAKHSGAFEEDFLKDLTKTDTGLLYKDIDIGKGEYPKDGDAVTIQMVGYIYETGEKWTNTYKGIPAYQSVIRAGARPNQKYMKGLNEGVASMKRGGKRVLVIPAYLAYSYLTIYSEKDPSIEIIPGGSSLVCYIEMVDFRTLK